LALIIELLGTPSEEEMDRLVGEDIKKFIRSLGKKEPKDFNKCFP
jgi:hypothetical protein